MILGVTYMDVTKTENNIKTRQLLTERFTGTWAISYRLNKMFLDIDYTEIYTADAIAITRALDPRSEYSPTWSIQNIHSL
jgi:outer membrane receptor for ferrienterochelin and colicins